MKQKEESTIPHLAERGRPEAVFAEVERIFLFWGRVGDFEQVERCFSLVRALYHGNYPGYQACNTDYHNLSHVMDILLAAARLLDGKALLEGPWAAELSRDLCMAALLHDTGYIQKIEDTEGTGAKYTREHVVRSSAFTRENAKALGLYGAQAERLGRLIACTDLCHLPWDLGFPTEEEAMAGAVLGTADLLGQMGDRAYLEKLLFLYYEFREAGFPGYQTEFDILRNTLGFYDQTRKRLDEGLGGLSRYAREHFFRRFRTDRDVYMESIEHQMEYLKGILADSSTNFRKKLHRLDLESVSAPRIA